MEFIERPFLKEYCEKCENHYLLDEDEARCRKMKLGQSDVMCVQVVRCDCYKEKGGVE